MEFSCYKETPSPFHHMSMQGDIVCDLEGRGFSPDLTGTLILDF